MKVYILLVGALLLSGCYETAFQPSYVISQTPPEDPPTEQR